MPNLITFATQEEIDAAALEGLAPMPEDLKPLHAEGLMLKAQIEQLEGRLAEIKGTVSGRLAADGMKAYVLNGKKKLSRRPGTRTGLRTKDLRNELPHVYDKYKVTTEYESIHID